MKYKLLNLFLFSILALAGYAVGRATGHTGFWAGVLVAVVACGLVEANEKERRERSRCK
jgi:protein-S-isoprenylcysteine O-methyltransferase Ste14